MAPGELDPDLLAASVAADRSYDVFLSFTWTDIDAVLAMEKALTGRGLRVFRDSQCIEEFDGITAELVRGLASSTVLLAYYSPRFPTRYACQWELTAAFIAAQRDGDPRRRVLVVNPVPGGDHVAPVELDDARFFVPEDGWERLADRVQEKVNAASGPLGTLRSTVDLPERLRQPRRFVGRYRELWQIHSALHATDVPASRPPQPCATVLVKGFISTGKTSLAKQYGLLFRDAFPGGVFWVGPLTGDARGDYFAQVRAIARDQLNMDVRGVEPARLRAMLAAHFRGPALWIVDDVPPGLGADVLTELLIPSPHVRTLFTSRTVVPDWPGTVIDLGGLHTAEGIALFGGDYTPQDRDAVARLVVRCGGHPDVIARTAHALRTGQGIVDSGDLAAYLDNASVSVIDAVQQDVFASGDTARRILGLSCVLSAASFPPKLILDALSPIPAQSVNAALSELLDRSLASRSGENWQVHALIQDAARNRADVRDLGETARAAARALQAMLSENEPYLHQHAGALADNDDVPTSQRVQLLTTIVRWYEEQGDARAARQKALRLVEIEPSIDALLLAARTLIAAGDYEDAIHHCRTVIEQTTDVRAEYWARMLAAQAFEHEGEYAAADRIFPDTAVAGWMDRDERLRAEVARVIGLRLRGELTKAIELLNAAFPEPDEEVTGPGPVARLERARLQFLTGRIKDARKTSADLVATYRKAGMGTHPVCMDAMGAQAEAELTIDMTELNVHSEHWERSERELAQVHERYVNEFGSDNPRTLTAAVQWDRAQIARGRPNRALRDLADTEATIIRALGEDHPLRWRARYAMAQAHGQLRNYRQAKDILSDLLPHQVSTLGAHHPESLTTKVDLGVTLGLIGRQAEGVRYVDEAVPLITNQLGWRSDLWMRCRVAKALLRLPAPVFLGVALVERLFGKQKTE